MKEPVWIEERDALALHDLLLARHGGVPGLRDQALLQSVLAPPSPNLIGMAAVYTVGIVRNRPFIDGNKRTGFIIGLLFLEVNGYRFTASEDEAIQAVLGLAAGTIDETGYRAWLRANVKGPAKPR